MSEKLIKSNKNVVYDKHDLALECCGYLKTKLFMAKRISEQQVEIEQLKYSLTDITLKYMSLFDILKTLNNSHHKIITPIDSSCKVEKSPIIRERTMTFGNLEKSDNFKKEKFLNKSPVSRNNEEDDLLNLSGDNTKSVELEIITDKHNEITKNSNSESNIFKEKSNKNIFEFKNLSEEDNLNKTDNVNLWNENEENQKNNSVPSEKNNDLLFLNQKFLYLENENLKLKKENLQLIQEFQEKKLELSKYSYEKFILFSELNELINTLSKVDLNLLNQFYVNNINIESTNYKRDIYSSMGIKYNVLSSMNLMGISSLNYSQISSDFKKNNENQYLFSEKYIEITKNKIEKFEEELNDYVFKSENVCRNASMNNSTRHNTINL